MNEEQVEGYEEVPEEQKEQEEVPEEEEAEEGRPSAQEIAFRLGSGLGSGVRSVATGIGGGLTALGKGFAVAPPITPVAGRPFGSPLTVEPQPEDPLADLFEVPQETDNDMYTDDLLSLGSEEEVDDLLEVGDVFEVTQEDIMGKAPAPKFKRTHRIYTPMGAIRGIR